MLEGTLGAIAFAKLKLKVTAGAFKNSGLKLSILGFKSFNSILVTSDNYK